MTGRSSDDGAEAGGPRQPRPDSVEFVTTEHFTLQGARTTATTESTGRATIFLGAVSAGMVALGFVAQATQLGTTFFAFGLILLITLSFVGFATFDRALQAGVEDLHYAQRIASRTSCSRALVMPWTAETTVPSLTTASTSASWAQLQACMLTSGPSR